MHKVCFFIVHASIEKKLRGFLLSCPCHSSLPYAKCCEPFHLKKKKPGSSKELMRSRYSAYSLGLGEYIIHTSHPDLKKREKEERLWLEEIQDFSKATEFLGLTIEEEGMIGETRAFVTFIALLKQGEQLTRIKEKSFFELQGDQWLYHSGLVEIV